MALPVVGIEKLDPDHREGCLVSGADTRKTRHEVAAGRVGGFTVYKEAGGRSVIGSETLLW